jgi:hypothetical protein
MTIINKFNKTIFYNKKKIMIKKQLIKNKFYKTLNLFKYLICE